MRDSTSTQDFGDEQVVCVTFDVPGNMPRPRRRCECRELRRKLASTSNWLALLWVAFILSLLAGCTCTPPRQVIEVPPMIGHRIDEPEPVAEDTGRRALRVSKWILNPRGNSPQAEASRMALLCYASEIQDTKPELAADLRAWVADEMGRIGR